MTTQEKTLKSNKHESRCGKRCSICPSRAEFNCDGCLSEKPFLASEECEIKLCCEKKGLEHCGDCPDFPCSMLKNMSYDEDDGDDGEQILNCKHWHEDNISVKENKKNNYILCIAIGFICGAVLASIMDSIIWFPLSVFISIAIAYMINITKHEK